jgi:hypothetical protein
MIKAYVNYPNPHITVHQDLSCEEIQKMNKPDQRYVRINIATISVELEMFDNKEYIFAAHPGANDMWLEIDFSDSEFENAVLEYIRRSIGRHYSPFSRVVVESHC